MTMNAQQIKNDFIVKMLAWYLPAKDTNSQVIFLNHPEFNINLIEI